MILLAIVAVVLLTVVLELMFGARLPRPYSDRPCTGKDWKRAWPLAKKSDVRDFLALVASAFALNKVEQLRLRPTDSVFGIYRAIYPNSWMPDSMELETLARTLEEDYGVNLADMWHDAVTLGDVFGATQRSET